MSYMSYEIIPARHQVKAWPKLRQLIGPVEAHIAGGYAAWHMSQSYSGVAPVNAEGYHPRQYHTGFCITVPADCPTDLDIFTYDEVGYDTLARRLKHAGFRLSKESKYCTTWLDSGYLVEDNWSHLSGIPGISFSFELTKSVRWPGRQDECRLPIQLIKPVFGKNVHEVLEHFDFYAIKFALLNGETVYAHKDAVKQHDARIIRFAHPEDLLINPFYVLGRAIKYSGKGYNINYMEMLKMVATAQTADPTKVEMTQLQEIVQHFGCYLRSPKMGRGEDFRPTFEDAYGEWLRCLLTKKAKLYIDGQKIR